VTTRQGAESGTKLYDEGRNIVGNARFVSAVALILVAVGCATPGTPAPAKGTAVAAAPGSEEVRFMGHRLVVQLDAAGKPTSARAWDPSEKEVPAVVVPIGEVNVCAPKPVGPTASAPQCEPFSFIPEKTSFKTGANSICWYYVNGRIVYYPC
jgi:hypothetical protein